MSKSVLDLAKELDFTNETDYLMYIIESKINGNISQAKELFNELPRDSKKFLIELLRDNFEQKELEDFFLAMCDKINMNR